MDKPIKYAAAVQLNYALWRQLKKTASQQKISVSEFLRRLIVEKLAKEKLS